jgi:hypothetical protein
VLAGVLCVVLQVLCLGPQIADGQLVRAAAAPCQGVLYDLRACLRSNTSALLVRGHQRRRGRASGDFDDASDRRCKGHGQFTISGGLSFAGWLATTVMAAAAIGMFITSGH